MMKKLPKSRLSGTSAPGRVVRSLAFAILFLSAFPLLAQDRNIQKNEVYPAAMFIENGGRFINVKTSLTYLGIGPNAVGDGVNDDGDEIIATIDWVVNKLRDHYANGGGCGDFKESYPIYLPNGTYKVSKSLVYSGDRLVHCVESQRNDPTREGLQKLMFIGQSREGTVVQLRDNASGFGAGAHRPVMTFSSFNRGVTFNNSPAGFVFRNITVNTGSGNPGAIGLDFLGANTARLDNVRFTGSGEIGLHYRIGSVHGYSSNIIVEGFDYGIYLEGNTESHPTIEYVTLRNQRINAIYLEGISASIRKVQSDNSVTGVRLKVSIVSDPGRLPHLTILDCEFKNGSSSNTAFQLDAGFLFARNINVSGYGSGVKKGSTVTVPGSITEYISAAATTFSSSRVRSGPIKSMNLPIEDWPIIPWETNLSNWANVQDFGAAGNGSTDDTQAIQAAMNSGKPVIYFPKQSYRIDGIVNIPASVKQIIGGVTIFEGSGTKFDINQSSSIPLLITDVRFESGGNIRHSAMRTLISDNGSSSGSYYITNFSSPGTKAFINDVHGLARGENDVKNVDIWVRGNNNEKVGNFQFTAGANTHIWMLGFKSEKTYTVFKVKDGGFFEVLGGVMNSFGSASPTLEPTIVNDNSHLSIVVATNGPDRGWSPVVRDIQGGTIKTWQKSDFPNRGWDKNFVIPLYASYDPSLVPQPAPPPAPTDTVSTPHTTTAPVIDGNLGEYILGTSFTRTVNGTSDNSASFGTKWDNNYLYAGIKVLDASLKNESPENWKDDGIELYLDANHNKGTTYDSFDRQYILGWGDTTLTEQNGNTTGVLFAQKNITGGYQMELAIPWSNLGISPSSGTLLGFDLGVNDDDDGGDRDGQLMWAGNSDNFRNTSAFGTAVLVPPAASGSFTLEAEDATISQAVVDNIHAGYTGTGFVDYNNVAGSYVEWTVNVPSAGSYQLTFRYANGSTANRPCTIRANGTVVNSSLDFNPSGAWTSYQYSSAVIVTLNAGQNTVRATANAAAGGPNMDHLKVTAVSTTTLTLEAEDATFSQAVVDNIHAGYTGTGFVDYNNVAGSYVEWTVNVPSAGSYQLTFRYANGSTANRPCTIRANGTVVNSSLDFNPSGAWTNYQYSSAVIFTLNASQNTVRATANAAAGGPNMDHLKVTGSGNTLMSSPVAGETYTIREAFPASAGSIQVYPNPTSRQIRITGAGTVNGTARIYDQQGRLVLSGRLDGRNLLDVSILSKGVYILEVKGERQTFRTKIIKE